MQVGQNVPKRCHLIYRRRWTTQRKAYDAPNCFTQEFSSCVVNAEVRWSVGPTDPSYSGSFPILIPSTFPARFNPSLQTTPHINALLSTVLYIDILCGLVPVTNWSKYSGLLTYELNSFQMAGRNSSWSKSKTIFPIRNNVTTYNAFRNSQSTPYLTFS
jgi:hypothetical protein